LCPDKNARCLELGRRVRARIENVFGASKRCYGLHRMCWLGLAKAGLQVRLVGMAYNLRRSWRLLEDAPE
jgi:IS5 family transposase